MYADHESEAASVVGRWIGSVVDRPATVLVSR